MNEQTIGFIGGGNMASSLIGGLISDGVSAENIWVADVDDNKLAELRNRFKVNTTNDNAQVVAKVRIVVLAVKPQLLRTVASEVGSQVAAHRSLVISIAAGIRSADLNRWLGGSATIVRCMPNTPSLVQSGATALYGGPTVSSEQRDMAESVLRSVGLTIWVEDEAELDTVTALSGSGPAYFFLLMSAMEQSAIELGLEPNTARLLTQQTAFGAAKLALEAKESPAELGKRVTSPGGTTQKAIETFQRGGLTPLVAQAMQAALRRSIELSDELGGDQ